ncbi:MAG: hypothetical protein IPP30_04525 [Flavobacterium sp.]|nr:hypothetical protein [Flavobacterium sp.]
MKFFKLLFCAAVFSFMASSCSDSGNDSDNNNNNNNNNSDPNPAFAMTWKMNGVQFNRNNTWGTNESTPNLFTYYPDAEFIRLQANSTLTIGDGIEINLILKRTDLVVGTYPVNNETDMVTTHIDLINNSNDVSEWTREGAITITSINTTTKRVKGTFHFKTSDDREATPYIVNYDITNGTFDYRYDIPN